MENISTHLKDMKIASPEKIRELSGGEVKKTNSYELNRIPVSNGLFDNKIFHDLKLCKELNSQILDKGISLDKIKCKNCKSKKCCYCENIIISDTKLNEICENCLKHTVKCPYECLGRIELAVPVVHIWYLDYIEKILDIKKKDLKAIINYEKYIVTEFKSSNKAMLSEISEGMLLTEEEVEKIKPYGDEFKAETGAEAILTCLKKFDEQFDIEKSKIENLSKKEISETEKEKLKKRLELVDTIKRSNNKFSWMILTVLPVVPPSVRAEVKTDNGFIKDDLFYLYELVINRNEKLKRFRSISAPLTIIKNESRLLQQAVDHLFDNAKCKEYQKKKSNGQVYKSLTDKLSGKQGLFRQNLLGKRVDFSGRSVIVVGPKLKLWQCGLPYKMAVELFRPHLIKELKIESIIDNLYRDSVININETKHYKGILQNTKRYDFERIYNSLKNEHNASLPDLYETLERIIKEHPVILNRQPSLHRLSMQAFLPVLVDGNAIKLHPLACKAFGADFDGDNMAIHVPLTIEAQMECWNLMLSARNILDPATGKTIVAPSQDMILGIYYMTAIKPNAKGTGRYFSSFDEVRIASEFGYIDTQALIYVLESNNKVIGKNDKYLKTTAGRILFNEELPEEIEFINEQLGEKELKILIEETYKIKGPWVTVRLHDALKDVGFKNATLYGSSLSISELDSLLSKEEKQNIGNASDNEKSKQLMKEILKKEKNSFNSIAMMVNSEARGKPEQISQIVALKGFVPKPSETEKIVKIESNYLKGLNSNEYFISSSGTRKDLYNAKFSTPKAGYLTRRLIYVAQSVVIQQEDCGSKEPSVLNCKCINGLCAKCYGVDLALNQQVQEGTPVGLIAAQSIGQIFSQKVLKSKHNYGVAGSGISKSIENSIDLFEIRFEKDISIINGNRQIYEEIREIILSTIKKEIEGDEFERNPLVQKLIKENPQVADKIRKIICEEIEANPQLLVDEIKQLYEEELDEKHIAVIVRQMFDENGKIRSITKAALESESFIAASSFQKTSAGLSSAALLGKKDSLNGIVENVIFGNIIPAGTGYKKDSTEKRDD